MKRHSFIRGFLALATLVSVPFNLAARSSTGTRDKKGFLVKAGVDRFNKTLTPFEGDRFFCKVSSRDTDDDLYIFESTRQEEGGPPLHFHYDQDEWWYVLEGEFLIQVGEQVFEAKAGDCVFGPRRVPHTFAMVGKKQGRILMLFQPAGEMEACFEKLSAGVTKNMTLEERDQFRKDHGFERVGPPLRQLKQ